MPAPDVSFTASMGVFSLLAFQTLDTGPHLTCFALIDSPRSSYPVEIEEVNCQHAGGAQQLQLESWLQPTEWKVIARCSKRPAPA
ncbi:hypothetical protein AG1IA_07063 [Rhizoctonia solani AG-1 IA]|uniref:Uncharacterized protein n=1 Tax=Thanatephorus cucumeris (strain AG1-IA) TaxID=983506 RepID=L8WLS9_THACA|nr:hypothetical protein AG1IA_07063 [Rhizoctonia solani AG-1 IA]